MAIAKTQNTKAGKKTYTQCRTQGHYVCWLGDIWVNPNATDKDGNQVTDATIVYRIIDGPAGGQYLYDHYRISTEAGAGYFEKTLQKMVPAFYHEEGSDWTAEIAEIKELVGPSYIIVSYSVSTDGYDRVYYCGRVENKRKE